MGVHGAPSTFEPDQSGGNVDMAEKLPIAGTRSSEQPDNNNYSSRSVVVNGICEVPII